jgi:hypothetical protein
MAKHLPVNVPATRIIYYPDPTPAPVVAYTAAQLAAQREERALQYAQWRIRYAAIQEHDRYTRRILTRVLLTVAVVLAALVAWCGWHIYQALTHLSWQPITDAGPIVLGFLLGITVVGGCGCVTIVRHYH